MVSLPVMWPAVWGALRHRTRIICRKCGGLSYESQNEPRHFRALRKAQKIRVRLGGSANMTEPFQSRPRYMHRRTYQRLRRQYEAAMEQYVGGMALQFMPAEFRPDMD